MNDMKLQMIVTGDNSGLNAMLNQSDAYVRSFTTKARRISLPSRRTLPKYGARSTARPPPPK